ncbi:MAG TPA: hypothetical protein VIA29_06635 [Thermoanaerobaculia bacterium]
MGPFFRMLNAGTGAAPNLSGRRARRAFERIRRIRILSELSRQARTRELPVWLVGGAVRDLLQGREHPDLDVVVPAGSADALASTLSRRGMGTVVLLSDRSPRVVRVAGRQTLDLAELEGDGIGRDLSRRDFTVNAMALELSSGALVDPFGGLADLRRRRLRLVRPGNLEEDPLRVLRAARFYATHGLLPDRALTESCRAVAPRLRDAALERIATEISRLLEAPGSAPALAWAHRAGVLEPALGREIPGGIARRLGRLDARPVASAPIPARRTLRLALLADALEVPAEQIAHYLAGRRFSREEARRAARIVDLARRAQTLPPDRDWEWIVLAGSEGSDALRAASVLSPRGRRASSRLERKMRRPRPRVKVSGDDLIAWTGMAPGPEVGRILEALEVEIRRGALRSRRQARAWVLSRSAATSPRPPTR